MGLAERAIDACESAMKRGAISERHVRDILKCKDIDVSRIEPFLKHSDSMIRLAAVRIVGEKGDVQALIDMVKDEKGFLVMSEIIDQLRKHGSSGLEALANLLQEKDTLLREIVIEMFRKSGRKDCLFPLLFDDNDLMVTRIKRYFDEK